MNDLVSDTHPLLYQNIEWQSNGNQMVRERIMCVGEQEPVKKKKSN